MEAQEVIDKLAQNVVNTFKGGPDKSIAIDALVSSVETDLNDDSEDGVFQDLVDLVADHLEKSGYRVITPGEPEDKEVEDEPLSFEAEEEEEEEEKEEEEE
jgi:hypothetical protein